MVLNISAPIYDLVSKTCNLFKVQTIMSIFSSPMKWRIESLSSTTTDVPRARSGHRIVTYNGQIFCFGGYNPDSAPDSQLFQELWKFNLTTNHWQKIDMHGDIPNNLASHSAKFCVLDNQPKMIVYGGTGVPFGFSSSNKVFICDLTSGQWQLMKTTGENGIKPVKLYGQAVCLVKDRYFYTIGGTTGHQYHMDVHRLDLRTKTWKLLHLGVVGFDAIHNQPNEPSARYRHEIVHYENKLYLFGGGTASDNDGFDEIYAFDLNTNTWTSYKTLGDCSIPIDESILEQYPERRKCHTCVQRDQFVYLIGGYDNSQIFSDIWRFDLGDFQWRKLNMKLETPVYFHDSALTQDGKIVIFGGVEDINSNTRTNQVQTCYIEVPSLRQMSWEAINSFVSLKAHSPTKLYEEGVPEDLICQLNV